MRRIASSTFVNHAKPFTVIGKGVMKSAADIDGHTIFQAHSAGDGFDAGCQPEGMDQFAENGTSSCISSAAKVFFAEFVDVLRCVAQQDILIGCGLRDIKKSAGSATLYVQKRE
jgi:hypothetical protein